MDSVKKSIVELNISLIIMGGTTIFPKVIDLPVDYIILGRALVAAIAIYIFIQFSGKKINLKFDKNLIYIILSGIFLAFHWMTLFASIQLSTVSIGILSFFIYPVITIFLGYFFLKTKLYFLDLLLAVFIILGLFFVMSNFYSDSSYMLGIAYGILSAVLYSIRIIISKKILYAYSGEETMLYQSIIVVACLIPVIFIKSVPLNDINISVITSITLLGIFFTALPHTLFVRSLVYLEAKTVGILSSLQPLYCIGFAILLLGEMPSLNVVIGGVFILSSVFCETVRSAR